MLVWHRGVNTVGTFHCSHIWVENGRNVGAVSGTHFVLKLKIPFFWCQNKRIFQLQHELRTGNSPHITTIYDPTMATVTGPLLHSKDAIGSGRGDQAIANPMQ